MNIGGFVLLAPAAPAPVPSPLNCLVHFHASKGEV
jgi:hypothetical protein